MRAARAGVAAYRSTPLIFRQAASLPQAARRMTRIGVVVPAHAGASSFGPDGTGGPRHKPAGARPLGHLKAPDEDVDDVVAAVGLPARLAEHADHFILGQHSIVGANENRRDGPLYVD